MGSKYLEIRRWKVEVRRRLFLLTSILYFLTSLSELDVRKLGFRRHRLGVRSWSLLLTSLFYILTSLSTRAQSLQDYQELAMKQNPSIQAKYKTFEAAMTKVQQVNSLPDPTFSLGYFISPVETRVGPQKARFSLSQMFPWFGTLKAQGDVAALSADAVYQQFVDAQNKVKFEVAKAYYPLQELDKLIQIQQSNLELLKSWKQLATVKYENGNTSLADVLRVDLMIKEIETELSLLHDMRQPLTVTFNRILNQPDATSIVMEESMQMEPTTSMIENDWSANPRIDELNKRIAVAKAQSAVIEKQGLPKIGAGLDYVIVGERTDMNVPDNGKNAFMPMVSISLPIFRGKYKAAIKETELQTEAYQHSIMAIENELASSYENLKYNVNRENQLMDLYKRQIVETEQIQSLMLSAFSNSGEDLDELLRIQMQLLGYQMKEVKAKTRLQTALANIDYVLANSN